MNRRERSQLLQVNTHLEKVSVNDIGHSNRGEGKTFRRLMLALYKASTGEKVVYAVDSISLADWTAQKAMNVLHAYGVETIVNSARRRIEIKGAGCIEFMVLAEKYDFDRLRGISGNLIEDFCDY